LFRLFIFYYSNTIRKLKLKFSRLYIPNGKYVSTPRNEGVQEYITVVSGKFTHKYKNDTDEDVILQIVVHYP
jgi:hypothetical protein